MQTDDFDDDDILVINYNEEETARLDLEFQEQTRKFLEATGPYRLGLWYEHLKDFTFRTVCFTLTAVEGFALFQLYYSEALSVECKKALDQLELRVDECIHKYFDGGCFPKLSTRSPKDYSWDFRDEQYFKSSVASLSEFMRKQLRLDEVKEARSPTLLESNSIYKFLMENSRERSRIRSGKDFIRLFSKSQRIVIDLENLSTAGGQIFRKFKAGDWSNASLPLIDVCFREWKEFLWQNEFRCFYNDYRLTAISPYEQDCLFEKWVGRENELRARLSKYFAELEPHLRASKLSKGVLDIYFSNDELTIGLIEINPFDANTRASLFSWEKDIEQLTSGNEVEVRLNITPTARIEDKLKSIMGMLQKRSIDVVREALLTIDSAIVLK